MAMKILPQQRGTGLIEFTLVAMPVIFLCLTGIELAHWLNMRQSLNLALVQAARAGISKHAEPAQIAAVFELNLDMLYPQYQSKERILNNTRLKLGRPWQITIYHPGPGDFDNYGQHNNQNTINNSYQRLQYNRQPDGIDTGSNIFIANTLEMGLVWPHKPVLPILSTLIKSLAPFTQNYKSIFQAGYLPFVRHISMPMQSDPKLWPELDDQRVVYADTAIPNFDDVTCNLTNKCEIKDWYDIPAINPTENNNSGLKPDDNSGLESGLGDNTGNSPIDEPEDYGVCTPND